MGRGVEVLLGYLLGGGWCCGVLQYAPELRALCYFQDTVVVGWDERITSQISTSTVLYRYLK